MVQSYRAQWFNHRASLWFYKQNKLVTCVLRGSLSVVLLPISDASLAVYYWSGGCHRLVAFACQVLTLTASLFMIYCSSVEIRWIACLSIYEVSKFTAFRYPALNLTILFNRGSVPHSSCIFILYFVTDEVLGV